MIQTGIPTLWEISKPIVKRTVAGYFFMRYRWKTLLGVLFIFAYEIQYIFDLSPVWIKSYQANSDYKVITGGLLLAYMLGQWSLAKRRIIDNTKGDKYQHRIFGVYLPVVLYFHSVNIGADYQSLMVLVFFSNYLLGLLNPGVIRLRVKIYYSAWISVHIILSMVLMAMIVFHVYVVYAY